METPNCPLLVTDTQWQELADQLVEQFGLTQQRDVSGGLVLLLNELGLQLKNLDEPKTGAVAVDFASGSATWRRQHGGGNKEAVAKAVGVKGQHFPTVLDATAGLGRDSFVLASLGCQVSLCERHPVVAALLSDGIERGLKIASLAPILSRMQLFHQSAISLLSHWQSEAPEVVYLDPMFPHRKKSALVKKEMRMFQQLLGPDLDADDLLFPALALATKRVVVKRPANAPFLNAHKPDIELKGKANRFDVYLVNQSA